MKIYEPGFEWYRDDRDYAGVLRDWNGNAKEAALQAVERLELEKLLHPTALRRLILHHPAVPPHRMEERFELIPHLVAARLDDWSNRGNALGVVFSRYVHPITDGGLRPPGRPGERLLIEATGDELKRSYCWPGLVVRDVRYDLRRISHHHALARAVAHKRLKHLAPDVLRRLGTARGEGVPLEEDRGLADPWRNTEAEGLLEALAEPEAPAAGLTDEDVEAELGAREQLMSEQNLAALAQEAAEAVTAALRMATPQQGPWRFCVVTLLFLRWFLEEAGRPESVAPHAHWMARLAGHPAGESLDALNTALTAVDWESLNAAAAATEWSRLANDLSHPRWRELRGERPRPYELWRTACKALRRRDAEATVAQTLKRQERNLAAFYTLIGGPPVSGGTGGDPGAARRIQLATIAQFDRLLAGDLGPEEASELRARTLEDEELFWAFNDYTADRAAWGDLPNPAVAALRERLRAYPRGLLALLLGDLPAAWDALSLRIAERKAWLAHGMQVHPVCAAPEAPFSGFALRSGDDGNPVPLRVGDSLVLMHLSTEGEALGASRARILALDADPAGRTASVTLGLGNTAPEGAVLTARLEASTIRFSLAGEVRAGEVTLQVDGLPDEVPDLTVDGWHLILP